MKLATEICDQCGTWDLVQCVELENVDVIESYDCTRPALLCADCLRTALALIEGEQSTSALIGRDEETGDFEAVEIAASFVDEEEE
jgi:hypothetical protein